MIHFFMAQKILES